MKSTSVRVGEDDLEWLRPLADAEHRSLANMLHVLIHEAKTARDARTASPERVGA